MPSEIIQEQPTPLSQAERGWSVETADGETVARVVTVEEGLPLVVPRPGLLDGLGPRLGDPGVGDQPLPLDPTRVSAVTDGVIRLNDVRGD